MQFQLDIMIMIISWDKNVGKNFGKNLANKKVLLRERKRHTARCEASARYAGGGRGYPIQSWWGEGLPHPVMVGVPHPVMVGGTPSSHGGGYPIQSCWGGTLGPPYHLPSPWGYPPPSRPGWGVPPPTIQTWPGVPPTPHHPDLAGGTPHH